MIKGIIGGVCALIALAAASSLLGQPSGGAVGAAAAFGVIAYLCLKSSRKPQASRASTVCSVSTDAACKAPTPAPKADNNTPRHRKSLGVDLEEQRRKVWNKAFRDVLWAELTRLEIFSDDDKERMYQLVVETKIEARGQWYKALFENFFQGKTWRWRELERWKKRFEEAGQWPDCWNLANADEKKLCYAFFDYIYSKSESREVKARLRKIGIKKAFLITNGDNSRQWVERCLAKKPNSMPPYFPGDQTLVNGFVEEMQTLPEDTIVITL